MILPISTTRTHALEDADVLVDKIEELTELLAAVRDFRQHGIQRLIFASLASGLAFDGSTCILLRMSHENRLPPVHPPIIELQATLRAYFGYLPEGQISTFLDEEGNAVATWEAVENRNDDRPASACHN